MSQLQGNIINLISEEALIGDCKPITIKDVQWVEYLLRKYNFSVTHKTLSKSGDYLFLTVAYDYPREFTDWNGRKFIVGPYHPKSPTWKPTKKVARITLNHTYHRAVGETEWRNHISADWSLLGDVWCYGVRGTIYLDLPAGMRHIYDYAESIQDPIVSVPFENSMATLADYLKNGKVLPIPEKFLK